MSARWRVLALTSVSVFAVSLDTTILYVAFPDLRRSFAGVSAAQLSWVLNAYTIVLGALLVTAGRLADRLGRRATFLFGLLLFTIASAACGRAPSPGLLIAGRVVQAAGAASLLPASLALVLAAFPREEHPVAVGIWAAVGALAAAVGPALGSAIVQSAGWRWALYLNVPVGLAGVVASRKVLIESRDPSSGGWPDGLGILLAITFPGLLALGIIGGGAWGLTDWRTVSSLLGSVILLGALLLESRRAASPVIDLRLFEDRNYRLANLATLVFAVAFSAMFLGLILYLTQIWHYSTLRAGLAMTPGPLVVMPFAVLGGRVAARRGHRGILVLGGLALAVSGGLMLGLRTAEPAFLRTFLPPAFIVGLGIGFVLPSLSSVAAHGLSSRQFGLGVAVNQAVRQVGSVIGVALVIAFTARAPEGSLRPFQEVFVLLILAGLLVAALGSRVTTRPRVGAARPP